MRIISIALILLVTFAGTAVAQTIPSAAPHIIVYKTKEDYRKRVAVTLSDDKTKVVSYPDPKDIRVPDMLPVQLHKGYLLDKRGINRNTAFILATYEPYSKLKKVPTPGVLWHMVKDKNPFTVMYDCGSRYARKDVVKEINALIDSGKLESSCTSMQ
jgi:hypothetical protein